MSFLFVTPQVTLARNAGALYNYGLGNELMASLASSNDINGLLNSIYTSSVGSAATSTVASTLVANLGITGTGVAAAQAYVVAQLNPVAVSGRGKAINDILMAFSSLTDDATYGAAARAWNAKVANAVAYAAMAGSKDTTFAEAVPPTPEPSFMLTTGIDRMPGIRSTAGTTDTSGSDVIDGSVNANGVATLTSVDNLDGGLGNDIIVGGLAGGNIAPTLRNIESGEFITSAATTFDLVNTTGLTAIKMRNSTNTLTVANIPGTSGTTYTIQDQAADFTLNFANTALAGASTFSLALSGAQSDGTGGAIATINQQAGTDVSGLETLTISSGGSNTNFLDAIVVQNAAAASTLTSLSVSGAQGLTVANAVNATVRTVDASQMTGTVGLTLPMGATAAATVTGSSGADTFTLAANAGDSSITAGAGNDVVSIANFTTADTINGGDGAGDRLDISAANAEAIAAALTNTTNFEQISLNTAGTAGSGINATRFGAIDTVQLRGGTGAGTYGVTMQAGTVTLGIGNAGAGALGGALTATDTGTATTDVLNLTNRHTTGAVDVFASQAITSAGYETVNLSTGGAATLAQTVGVVTLNNDSLSGANTLTISGANAITVARVDSNASGLLTVDASGLTGTSNPTLTMTAAPTFTVATGTVRVVGSGNNDTLLGAATSASTVEGGAGRDTITTGTAADSISGGTGNDTITAGGGNDIVDAGDGNDSVTMAAGTVNVSGGAGNDTIDMAATLTASDTVNGGDNTDTLSLAAAATAATAAGVSGFETLSIDAAFNQGMEQFTNNGTFTRINYNVGGNVAVTNAGALIDTIQLESTGAGNTFSMARLVDTSTNALTVVPEDLAGGTVTAATLTLNDEETLNINTGTAADATANNGTGNALTITTLNAGDLTTLNVAGANAVTITNAIAGAANLATIAASTLTAALSVDASASTANMTATGSFAAANTITGGTGADTITGGTQADSLTGGNGADSINGGAGADSLLGGIGADTIVGDIGNDTITGGTGNDNLTGGAGADDFVFEASNGVDTITDFVSTSDDLIVTAFITAPAANEVVITTAGAQQALVDDRAYIISMNGAAANLTTGAAATLTTSDMTASTLTALAAYLSERFTAATNDNDVFAINWTAGGSTTTYIYNFVDAGGATIAAAELTLVGVVSRGTAVLVAGDLNA